MKELIINFDAHNAAVHIRIGLAESLQTGVTRIRAINHPAGGYTILTRCVQGTNAAR